MNTYFRQAWKKVHFSASWANFHTAGQISLQCSVRWFPLCISLFPPPSKSQNILARGISFFPFFGGGGRLYFRNKHLIQIVKKCIILYISQIPIDATFVGAGKWHHSWSDIHDKFLVMAPYMKHPRVTSPTVCLHMAYMVSGWNLRKGMSWFSLNGLWFPSSHWNGNWE